MKKLIYTLAIVLAAVNFSQAQQSNHSNAASVVSINSGAATKTPVIKWESTSHNFGKITKGKPVSYTFTLTNSGDEPLIIQSVKPTCGCTTDDYSKEAIAPGKSGFVKLTYNAANPGAFNKSATVITNADPNTVSLLFSGEVIAE